MENRYSKGVSKLYSYAYLLMGFVYIPIQLFTLTTVFQTIMPSLSLTWACVIGLVLAISYTVVSGVSGANYVSKVSCILMYLTMAVGMFIALGKTGGIANLKSTLDASYFTPFSMPTKTWFSWFLTCFVAFLTMQAAIQPSLIAKDDSNARRGHHFRRRSQSALRIHLCAARHDLRRNEPCRTGRQLSCICYRYQHLLPRLAHRSYIRFHRSYRYLHSGRAAPRHRHYFPPAYGARL